MVAREYVPIADLLPLIELSCQGVPRSVALFELRQAYADFCQRTRLWQSEIIAFALQEGVTEYELTTTALYAQPYFIQALAANGKPLTALTLADMTANEKGYCAIDAGMVRIYPIVPNAVITGRVVLIPTKDAEMIPKTIYSAFGRCLSYMAKASLMLQPNKPWSNPSLANVNLELSSPLLADALHRASQGYATPKRPVKAYYF